MDPKLDKHNPGATIILLHHRDEQNPELPRTAQGLYFFSSIHINFKEPFKSPLFSGAELTLIFLKSLSPPAMCTAHPYGSARAEQDAKAKKSRRHNESNLGFILARESILISHSQQPLFPAHQLYTKRHLSYLQPSKELCPCG